MKNILEVVEIILKLIKYRIRDKESTLPTKLGDKIILIGNGPSAKIIFDNLTYFENYDKLVVNFFPIKSEFFERIKPQYLCLLDPAFFCLEEELTQEKNKEKRDDFRKLKEVLEKVDWKLYIVTRTGRTLPINNNNIKYIKLATAESFGINNWLGKRKFAQNKLSIPAQNVMVGAINFSLTFGYTQIGLCGVEQNWLQQLKVDDNNYLYIIDDYFYDKEVSHKVRLNTSYENEVNDVLKTMKEFRVLSEIAEMNQITITNYAVDSYIQYFNKKKI